MSRDTKTNPVDLAAVRARLAGRQGQEYWKSLEEVASTPEFQEFQHREFPEGASELPQGFNRRRFLQMMGASLALAGLTACGRSPKSKILPYVKGPEQIIPGKPLFYATAIPSFCGIAQGVLVESHMGRPTKIEGNPEHPGSLGATDAFTQASILTLYDPDRSQVVNHQGSLTTWDNFLAEARPRIGSLKQKKGDGLRILTETVTSPTMAHEIGQILEQFPAAKWHQYEPLHRDNEHEGTMLAYGEPLSYRFNIERAEVIVCLGGDLFGRSPGQLRYARKFVANRKVSGNQKTMNRLYTVGSAPSLTEGMADHHLRLRSTEIHAFAQFLAKNLGVPITEPANPGLPAPAAKWIDAVARDLKQNRGKCLITTGEEQPPAVHALVHAMNHALGNVGATVIYSDPVEAKPINQLASLKELVDDMENEKVEILLIVGGNPVYDTPADVPFDMGLSKVSLRIRLGLYEDETSALCDWHLPQAHALESWGDVRGYDGTVTFLQPLILPLYGGRTALELFESLFSEISRTADEIVRDYWKSRLPKGRFETSWKRALHDGLVAGSAIPERAVSLRDLKLPPPTGGPPEILELAFLPDPTIGDGRFANNGWLQETPKTLTTITWDNAAMISPATAERLSLQSGEVVELRFEGHSLRAPVNVLPGQGEGTVTIHFGYGRLRAGSVGTGIGFNAYRLRTSSSPWFGAGLEVVKTGERYPLATTQNHHTMEGRNLIHSFTLADFLKESGFARKGGHGGSEGHELTLYPGYEYTGYAWGMAVDLNACIGCNACAVACQAENNIPVVGKEQVIAGREMNWLRIDRYFKGSADEPDTEHQPVLCMHCENAPCEVVCPVGATTHSKEGLNEMTYNRCVGTRYCSNNCPYKVRRFNFLQFHNTDSESLKMQRNPDVTVRMRGVMEKCTYCVQRINHARIQAELEDRKIRDGDIVTACQAACPTNVFTFGDINDPRSAVSRLKQDPRNYTILDSLNVKPRTSYLARLRNPNPELEKA